MYVLIMYEKRMTELLLSSFSSNLILAHNCNVSLYVLARFVRFQVNTSRASGLCFLFRSASGYIAIKHCKSEGLCVNEVIHVDQLVLLKVHEF